MVLAGNNEDFLNAEVYSQFLPAEQGKHGRIYFGFYYEVGKIAPFGGVNDHGLIFDTTSIDILIYIINEGILGFLTLTPFDKLWTP